jgi:hypothetical protein
MVGTVGTGGAGLSPGNGEVILVTIHSRNEDVDAVRLVAGGGGGGGLSWGGILRIEMRTSSEEVHRLSSTVLIDTTLPFLLFRNLNHLLPLHLPPGVPGP